MEPSHETALTAPRVYRPTPHGRPPGWAEQDHLGRSLAAIVSTSLRWQARADDGEHSGTQCAHERGSIDYRISVCWSEAASNHAASLTHLGFDGAPVGLL